MLFSRSSLRKFSRVNLDPYKNETFQCKSSRRCASNDMITSSSEISKHFSSIEHDERAPPSSWYLFAPTDLSTVSKRNSFSNSSMTSKQRQTTQHRSRNFQNPLDAIDFLEKYIEHNENDILLESLQKIAQELQLDENKNYQAVNNNHLQLSSTCQSHLQFSNNKEKKVKNERVISKAKKKKIDENHRKNDQKKEDNTDDELENKKSKKRSTRTRFVEETSSDSESISDSIGPSNMLPLRSQPKYYQGSETNEQLKYMTLNQPSMQLKNEKTASFDFPTNYSTSPRSYEMSPSQIHHQLQNETMHPLSNKMSSIQTITVQQQLQALAEMAHNGDEVLITLNVNTMNSKTKSSDDLHSPSRSMQQQQSNFQQTRNTVGQQDWSNSKTNMPRQFEIIAKGYARIQTGFPSMIEQSNMIPNDTTSSNYFRSNPSQSKNSVPPIAPIAPPIRPVSNVNIDRWNSRLYEASFSPDHQHLYNSPCNVMMNRHEKCDALCHSSICQPDFRGRPAPGVLINPFSTDSNEKTSNLTECGDLSIN